MEGDSVIRKKSNCLMNPKYLLANRFYYEQHVRYMMLMSNKYYVVSVHRI